MFGDWSTQRGHLAPQDPPLLSCQKGQPRGWPGDGQVGWSSRPGQQVTRGGRGDSTRGASGTPPPEKRGQGQPGLRLRGEASGEVLGVMHMWVRILPHTSPVTQTDQRPQVGSLPLHRRRHSAPRPRPPHRGSGWEVASPPPRSTPRRSSHVMPMGTTPHSHSREQAPEGMQSNLLASTRCWPTPVHPGEGPTAQRGPAGLRFPGTLPSARCCRSIN